MLISNCQNNCASIAIRWWVPREYQKGNKKVYFKTLEKEKYRQWIPNFDFFEKIFLIELFQDAQQLRNNIIHNQSPLKLYWKFIAEGSGGGLAFGEAAVYLPSKEVLSIVHYLFNEVLFGSIKIIFEKTD